MLTFIKISLLLIVSKVFASSNEMYFSIHSLHMTNNDITKRLEGIAQAKKVFVIMDDNEFDIQLENNQIFTAKTYLEKDRFTFFKDGIKFSTPLSSSNPVLRINHLEVEQADAHLSEKGIFINGERLRTNIYDLKFYVDNLDMSCLHDGFTTDFERACISNVIISPSNNDRLSLLTVTDLSEKKKFDVQIQSREVKIEDDKLTIDSEEIKGHLIDTNFELGRGILKCYKDPILEEIDVERLIAGCFYESSINVDNFKYKQSGINLKVSKAAINFRKEDFKLKADYASFRQNNEATYVSGMDLFCTKEIVTTKSIKTQNSMINGCIKESTFKVSNITNNESQDLFGEEKTDLKNLDVKINKGKFKISIKPKFIFRVPVLIEGDIKLNALVNKIEITVKDANVAGVPSKNYALKLIKKFIDSERVKIKDNIITIEI